MLNLLRALENILRASTSIDCDILFWNDKYECQQFYQLQSVTLRIQFHSIHNNHSANLGTATKVSAAQFSLSVAAALITTITALKGDRIVISI